MNIIIIGNGFDLAHELPTDTEVIEISESYFAEIFLNDYDARA